MGQQANMAHALGSQEPNFWKNSINGVWGFSLADRKGKSNETGEKANQTKLHPKTENSEANQRYGEDRKNYFSRTPCHRSCEVAVDIASRWLPKSPYRAFPPQKLGGEFEFQHILLSARMTSLCTPQPYCHTYRHKTHM